MHQEQPIPMMENTKDEKHGEGAEYDKEEICASYVHDEWGGHQGSVTECMIRRLKRLDGLIAVIEVKIRYDYGGIEIDDNDVPRGVMRA